MYQFDKVDSDDSEGPEGFEESEDLEGSEDSSEASEGGEDDDEVASHLEAIQLAQQSKKRKLPREEPSENKRRKVQMFSSKMESSNPFEISDEKAKIKSQLQSTRHPFALLTLGVELGKRMEIKKKYSNADKVSCLIVCC